jgi:uncharacterized protein YjbI with pentapeptide repeats
MANADHVTQINEGVRVWNAWRTENPSIRPDLRGLCFSSTDSRAELLGMNLREVDLSRADLSRANLGASDLSGARLIMAKLGGSDLTEAHLSKADLSGADLGGAHLSDADLSGADLSGADLSGADLNGADLNGADLTGAKLSRADLSRARLRADLSGVDLSDANLSEADLRGADHRGANLNRANLSGSKLNGAGLGGALLSEADLRGASLREANLGDADLSDANLSGADLIDANLSGADLTGAGLTGADLSRADLSGADLSGATLRKIDLNEADLSGANLDRADLSGANLNGANLNRANLSRASLNKANLSGSDLSGARLSGKPKLKRRGDNPSVDASAFGADLIDANLTGADLTGADLTGADLTGADLSGANLSGALLTRASLRAANLRDACLDGANLIDACLDGADLTDARLWETQRGSWSIKAIICQRAFWEREREDPDHFKEGEFERLFAEKPSIVLRYPGGMSLIDLVALPVVVERLQAEYPGSVLQVRSVQNDAGGASVTITVEDLASRRPEVLAAELKKLRNDLLTIQYRLRNEENLRLSFEAKCQVLVESVIPILAAAPRPQVNIGQLTAPLAVEGTTMNKGDTYNIPGQAAAVGRGAHAHDNTFQQIQTATDLPKLAEELGRLRAAMKGESTGTREQDKAIGAVADAEEAAIKGNGPAALRYLKGAGQWTIGIAEKIVVPVAAEALKRTVLGSAANT